MWQYIILFVLPFLFLIIPRKYKQSSDYRFPLILFFVILFFILALRDVSVGVDLGAYKYFFEKYSSVSWNKILSIDIEPAFMVLLKIISLFTNDFQWVIVAFTVLSVIPIAYVYVRESTDSALTISIFLAMSTFVMLFSGIRQSVAMGLGMIAYKLSKDKKLILFLLTVLLAFMFHRSAFILLLTYPVYRIRFNKKSLLVTIPLFILLLIFNKPIFVYLSSFFKDLYVSTIQETGAYSILILFMLFSVLAYVLPDETKIDEHYNGLKSILVLATFLQVFAMIHPLAMRMNYYFILIIPLTVSKCISIRPNRYSQVASLAKYVIIVVMISYYVINLYLNNPLHIVPYKFFWE